MSTTDHVYAAELRTATGSSAAKALRATGKVPVTVSRPGKPSLHLALDHKEARHLAAHVVHLCSLKAGDETITALKGDIPVHCLKDEILHIDLVQVNPDSAIVVDVAVVPDARNCPGVKAGGIVEQALRQVKVKCKAGSIPDSIACNLDNVAIMQTVYAKDLVMPAGVSLVTKPKTTVLSIVITRGMKKDDAAVAAAAAAPAAKDAKAAAPAAKKK